MNNFHSIVSLFISKSYLSLSLVTRFEKLILESAKLSQLILNLVKYFKSQ
ncbi:hypothetical protein HOF65_00070 [bacterium]|nr:hypothetical protein [bacterium]MBT3852446.1 hypothetical protein [bacterium]MBT4633423.1 hypothetical protein [bacterium]MBT6779500.1 hypothetical protein [bacterium]